MNSQDNVSYRIVIKYSSYFFNIGMITVQRFTGDILFTPSQVQASKVGGKTNNVEIDHISFHKTGRVHIKDTKNNRFILESGEDESKPKTNDKRVSVDRTAFNNFFVMWVEHLEKLPKIPDDEIERLDVILNSAVSENIEINFSMVSGKLLVKSFEGKTKIKVTQETTKKELLACEWRCLGHESGNADKILQFSLKEVKFPDDCKENIRIFFPQCSGLTLEKI